MSIPLAPPVPDRRNTNGTFSLDFFNFMGWMASAVEPMNAAAQGTVRDIAIDVAGSLSSITASGIYWYNTLTGDDTGAPSGITHAFVLHMGAGPQYRGQILLVVRRASGTGPAIVSRTKYLDEAWSSWA